MPSEADLFEYSSITFRVTLYLQPEGGYSEDLSEIAQAKKEGTFFEDKNISLKDDLDNVVTIPKGFKIAEDSATKVEDGVVVEDHNGNQFVWIPAKTGDGIIVHTTIGNQIIRYADQYYSQEYLPKDEETSVNENGGYYIGRYEAGDKESTDAKKMREEGASSSNTVTIKKGQAPYTFVINFEPLNLANEMASLNGYEATTKLTNCYSWDTAIRFIEIKNITYGRGPEYGESSKEGNYWNTTFEYTDIAGTKQTKLENSEVLVPTGQTTPVSNIYDMGGNCSEIATDYSYRERFTFRGGSFYESYDDCPAEYSTDYQGEYSVSFRIALFL